MIFPILGLLCLISKVSCSFMVICDTQKTQVEADFRRDSDLMFSKISGIWDCGQGHFIARTTSDLSAYRNCIRRLNLPSSYSNNVSFFFTRDFRTPLDFYTAIKSAGRNACLDLEIHDTGPYNSFSKAVILFGGEIHTICAPQSTTGSISSDSISVSSDSISVPISSHTDSSSFFSFNPLMIFLIPVGFFVIICIAMGVYYYMKNRKKLAGQDDETVVTYVDHQSQTSQDQSSTHPPPTLLSPQVPAYQPQELPPYQSPSFHDQNESPPSYQDTFSSSFDSSSAYSSPKPGTKN